MLKKTTETTEEAIERLERNIKLAEKLRQNDFNLANKNLEFTTYLTGTNTVEQGGKVRCKQCGKTFSWKEWGKTMSRSLRFAMKHLNEKHLGYIKGIGFRHHLNDWIDKQTGG